MLSTTDGLDASLALNIVDSVQASLLVSDCNGIIQYVNPAFCAQTGYSRAEVLGKTPSLLNGKKLTNGYYKYMWMQLHAGVTWRGRFQNKRKDGSLYWVEQTISPIRNHSGEIVQYVALGIEISEQQEKQELESKALRALRVAVDAIGEAFVIFDEQDQLLVCNENYRQLFNGVRELLVRGTTFESLIRACVSSGMHPESLGREESWIQSRLKIHQGTNQSSIQKLGDRWLRVIERKSPDGYTVGFRMDITTLMNARELAESSSRAKSLFLANMSHEIRTPMNAIIGFSELAMLEPMSPGQTDYLHKIQNASKTLLGIVNDILDYSKIESGKLNIERLPFDLEEVLNNVESIAQNQANAKKILFFVSVEPDVPLSLQGDPRCLTQILTNLLSNAIKFTEVGSVILTIRALEQTPQNVILRLSVCDTGIGIAEDSLSKLFNPFTQADSSTTRKYGGTGLGLSICKQLTGLMGGTIQAYSELGKGCVFNVDIPFDIVYRPANAMSQPIDCSEFETIIGTTDPHSKDVIYRVLSDSSMSMQFYASPSEIIAAAEKMPANKHGLFMIDEALGNHQGGELVEIIRKLPKKISATFIFLQNPDVVDLMKSSDGLARLVKPISPLVLRKKLQLLVDRMKSISVHKEADISVAMLKVLLVEDNEVNQKVGKGMLTALGASTVIADNGQIALELLERESFDLVLMDLQMPVMGGIQATQEIRKKAQFETLPIIALTAHAFAEEHQNCINAGMNDVLTKPITLNALKAKLEQYSAPGKSSVAQPEPGVAKNPPLTTAIDVAAGLMFSGDNKSVYQEALSLYLEKLPVLIQDFHAAWIVQDIDVAKRSVHSLRGMSGAVGATGLQTIAGKVENALKNSSLAGAEPLIQSLDQEVRDVLEVAELVLKRLGVAPT